MNYSFIKWLHVSCLLALLAPHAMADRPRPRPAFMPSTPSAAKTVATYSPSELVGAVVTLELPNGHPFGSVLNLETLKSTWPGAKDATKIDTMLQIVLDAPANSTAKEVSDSFANIRFVIQEVMDVSDQTKADAFIRIVAAQTDPLKIKRAKGFARQMFEELLDVRLLAYDKEALDDATEYTEQYKISENRPRRTLVVRQEAKRSILWTLNHTLKMGVDETPFTTADEAANCAALKTWLTANWTQVANKCAEAKAAPEPRKPRVSVQAWDARW
jgi:hypothetical protein